MPRFLNGLQATAARSRLGLAYVVYKFLNRKNQFFPKQLLDMSCQRSITLIKLKKSLKYITFISNHNE
ncbi:hypothetical protein BpHYR1_004505 [Brachionus plicatilis]|uniref:Uncharacterized protein n=1 Tax=Brachionus plicatilis TaxID=10195 RepID=A0A3M7SJ25_BRAPC|nr:hypothetical protein BpHYR1_004505 [Brachionus plicatilis]